MEDKKVIVKIKSTELDLKELGLDTLEVNVNTDTLLDDTRASVVIEIES